VDLSEEIKRAPPAPVLNQSFPSPKALYVRGSNNNNNNQDNVYGAVIMAEPLREFTRFI